MIADDNVCKSNTSSADSGCSGLDLKVFSSKRLNPTYLDPGHYRVVTKRVDDGFKLCNDLQNCIHERAEIEKAYAKNLKQWSRKWFDIVEKGPEYDMLKEAWKNVVTEADIISDTHLKMKDNLCADVAQKIRFYQKDNFHKSILNFKERRDVDEDFKCAQKQWIKLLIEAEKSRTAYYDACEYESNMIPSIGKKLSQIIISNNEYKKVKKRLETTEEIVRNAKERYENCLKNVDSYKPTYIQEMSAVFNKIHSMEELRVNFFKEMLHLTNNYLNIYKYENVDEIYKELRETIDSVDVEKDLNAWIEQFGDITTITTPMFVEYSDKRDIQQCINQSNKLSEKIMMMSNDNDSGDGDNNDEIIEIKSLKGKSELLLVASNPETECKTMIPVVGSKTILKDTEQNSDIINEYFSNAKKIMLIEL